MTKCVDCANKEICKYRETLERVLTECDIAVENKFNVFPDNLLESLYVNVSCTNYIDADWLENNY